MIYWGAGFVLAAALYFAIWALWPSTTKAGPSVPRSVALVVLGDIGRSPRMLYHAQSFADAGFKTYILAYKGELYVPLSAIAHVPTPPHPQHRRTR